MTNTIDYFWKLFANDQFVMDNLNELVLPTRNEPFYNVPALGNTTMFAALSVIGSMVVMHDYTKLVDNNAFIDLCTEYAAIPVGSYLQTKYQRENIYKISNAIRTLYKQYYIPIIVDPATLETNIHRVVKANLVALTKFNNTISDNLLIKCINET